MRDSDDEYVQSQSEDEANPTISGGQKGQLGKSGSAARGAGGFEVNRTWETIEEGADGTISGSVDELIEAGKRRRVLKDTTPIQRGIIRHLVLILDLSESMKDKDLRPTRYLLTIRYAIEFVTEYFEQNPISQLCIVGMRDSLAVPITDMGGNPSEHAAALTALRKQEPRGDTPSLQNALNMARGALYHAPSHGTREVLVIFGSIMSWDPGDIHQTIGELVQSRIMATVVGLAAEVAVCRTLVQRTNPAMSISDAYGIPLNEQHYRELFMKATTPPATAVPARTDPRKGYDDENDDPYASNLLIMGFPSRNVEEAASFCACHTRPTKSGYTCSRCQSKVCSLPTTCPVCGLTLILSTHLARSYHHLFPLRNWLEVSWPRAAERELRGEKCHPSCFSCLTPFPKIPVEFGGQGERVELPRGQHGRIGASTAARDKGVSESGRYECETCNNFFCIDCDVFAHEIVHNCPGCLSSASTTGGSTSANEAAANGKGGRLDEDVQMRNGTTNGKT